MLKQLSLENFRSYEKYHLDFSKTTILIGSNGIGKTNILEAIYLLSTGRSWRTKHDNETVLWQKDLAKITAKVSNDKETNLEMILQRVPSKDYPYLKLVKVNGVKKRLTELLGRLPTVLFSPEELQMISGSPASRRRFLDVLLCQIDKKYTLALLDLAKVIRGRNKLLYFVKIGRSKVDELVFWDERLVTLGSFVVKKRQQLITKLNDDLTRIYQTLSGFKDDNLVIKYKPTVEPEKFEEMLVANQTREIESAVTLFGPHRDDLMFMLNSRDVSTFGSRGEYRSVILAVKMGELEYLKTATEHKPILLLDDIFSELDEDRRLHLAKIIDNQQTIITTTDLDHIEKGLRNKAKIVELK
ncbi:MAG: DNA replication/repair protein RecF [Patescibacteria group bacterium]